MRSPPPAEAAGFLYFVTASGPTAGRGGGFFVSRNGVGVRRPLKPSGFFIWWRRRSVRDDGGAAAAASVGGARGVRGAARLGGVDGLGGVGGAGGVGGLGGAGSFSGDGAVTVPEAPGSGGGVGEGRSGPLTGRRTRGRPILHPVPGKFDPMAGRESLGLVPAVPAGADHEERGRRKRRCHCLRCRKARLRRCFVRSSIQREGLCARRVRVHPCRQAGPGLTDPLVGRKTYVWPIFRRSWGNFDLLVGRKWP